MPTLNHVLETHRSVLVLDAASTRVQVGWLAEGQADNWQASDGEAGTILFKAIEATRCDVNTIGAFIYCEGPGSILGIRTAAAAIRAWCSLHERPVYAYGSLALVSQALQLKDAAVIADARRELWHVQPFGEPMRRVPAPALPERLVTPEGFRSWSTLAAPVTRVPYELPTLFAAARTLDLFHPTEAPDAFMHEHPSYVTWSPQIHRAPAAL